MPSSRRPGSYFAQGDRLFFAKFGEVHPRFETPAFGIAIQAIWAMLLAFTGTYERLIVLAVVAAWIFHALTVAGVIILRRKRPDLSQPYNIWGNPYSAVLFITAAIVLMAVCSRNRPAPSLAPELTNPSPSGYVLFVKRTAVTQVFHALADPTRRAIFEQLTQHGEQTVHALTHFAGVSQPAVSKHLAVLKQAKLVRHRRMGRETHCRARPESLAPMVDWLRHYGAFWRDKFDNLEALLERME